MEGTKISGAPGLLAKLSMTRDADLRLELAWTVEKQLNVQTVKVLDDELQDVDHAKIFRTRLCSSMLIHGLLCL